MKIISFAWTTPALLAGAKTVTRREWSDGYARTFHRGDLVAAYDRNPRAHGKQVATIELTFDPYQEQLWQAPAEEYDHEGLAWMAKRGLTLPGGEAPLEFWRRWRQENPLVWVVPFRVVSLGKQP